ncbi:predicted protein [Chaetomium globosum CBS 148.51]|uniref:Uncharacterized protein n=1 Tax=Chaetomium globosum (strain ATCC 6205 / CBS 148.51 / DSM 1962 / NBRC 6347 / NRRL 1970) TaxID=306901 RepID=Q2HAI4_CHAGB|nr:uncharacterized protein CHGG_02770 [Chaetomium globosum CBS 148.51]EAQ90835.1 predicted protein [Chaetomium globosum CBS 148.51]
MAGRRGFVEARAIGDGLLFAELYLQGSGQVV